MPKKPAPEDIWRLGLQGKLPGLRRLRRIFRLLPAEKRCKNCHVPLSGWGGILMHLIGRHPYPKNPRFCNWCMWMCQAYPGGTEIELSLLFADVRGSTTLAESMTAAEFSQLMNRFYRTATEVLIRTDAFIDKFVGDEVVALYLPLFTGPQYARLAIQAAQDLLNATGYGDQTGPWLPVGVGVHTGIAYVGTVKGAEDTINDVTALGDAVNITARLTSKAGAGEALISEATCTAADLALGDCELRRLELKGKSEPVSVRVLKVTAE